MDRLIVAWALLATSVFIEPAHSAMIGEPDIGKVVTFIFTADNLGNLNRDPRTKNLTPYGTGFFVLVKNEAGGPGGYGYLVTDKHVLKDPQGNDFSRVYVRVNQLEGDAAFAPLDLVENGQSRVYTHPDPTVDLAVIPALPRRGFTISRLYPMTCLPPKNCLASVKGRTCFLSGSSRPITASGKMSRCFGLAGWRCFRRIVSRGRTGRKLPRSWPSCICWKRRPTGAIMVRQCSTCQKLSGVQKLRPQKS